MVQQPRTRNRQFALRISDNEQSLFDIKREQSKLNKTDFFVQMLNDTCIKVYHFNETVNSLYNELRKIGVNLNQIAALANSGKLPQAEIEICNMLGGYNDVMLSLKAFLDNPKIETRLVKVDMVM